MGTTILNKARSIDYVALGDKALTVSLTVIAWTILLSRLAYKSLVALRPTLVTVLKATLEIVEDSSAPAPVRAPTRPPEPLTKAPTTSLVTSLGGDPKKTPASRTTRRRKDRFPE